MGKADSKLAPLLMLALSVYFSGQGQAREQYPGQYAQYDAKTREWFRRVHNQNGIPCCDISDGYQTDYLVRDNDYFIPIKGNWYKIPTDSIIRPSSNPTGSAVVWYVHIHASGDTVDDYHIRCFVLPPDG